MDEEYIYSSMKEHEITRLAKEWRENKRERIRGIRLKLEKRKRKQKN